MGKTIQSAERTLILRVLMFFENEKKNGGHLIPVEQAIKRACVATGHSKSTLMRIKQEAAREFAKLEVQPPSPCPMTYCDAIIGEPSTSTISPQTQPAPKKPVKQCEFMPKMISLPTPGKKRKPSKRKIVLDNFELYVLKNIISSFDVNKEVPTVKKVLEAAKRDFNFRGGAQTLRLIMKNQLGYKFKKHKFGGKPKGTTNAKTANTNKPPALPPPPKKLDVPNHHPPGAVQNKPLLYLHETPYYCQL